MILRCLFAVIACLAISLPAYAGPDMQEGRWEVTSRMEMPGMPVNIPPMSHTQCLTKEDMVPTSSGQNQDCKVTDQKISGNTVSWKMECSGQGGTTKGSGKVTYNKNSFAGKITTTLPSQGNMQMISHISGRRLGPCK